MVRTAQPPMETFKHVSLVDEQLIEGKQKKRFDSEKEKYEISWAEWSRYRRNTR